MGDGRQDFYPYPCQESNLEKENKARRELSGLLEPLLQRAVVAVMVSRFNWCLKACGCSESACLHSFMDPGELIQAGLLVRSDKRIKGASMRHKESYDDLIDMVDMIDVAEILDADD